MNTTPVEVVAAVIERPDGSFLLAQRPAGKVYAGYWEFPGGKVEPGEPLAMALARELHEELGIDVERAYPWIVQTFTYPHATVRLNFFRVRAWRGEPHGKEAQRLSWQHVSAIDVSPLLPANAPVLRALQLPFEYAITHAGEIGAEQQLNLLDQRLAQGLRLIQVREKLLPPEVLARFAKDLVTRAHLRGAKVLVNADAALAVSVGADGVHLTSSQIAACRARPDFPLVAASTHARGEIERAAELGLDFVVLGPVKATLTHPAQAPIGWPRFGEIVNATPLPVFALGGLTMFDMKDGIEHGAHGVAAQRGFVIA